MEGDDFVRLHEKLESFKNLEKSWDGYNGEPISQEIVKKAKSTLRYMDSRNIELPSHAVPMNDGRVQLEYTEGRFYGTEIEITDENYIVLLCDESENIDEEVTERDSLDELCDILS